MTESGNDTECRDDDGLYPEPADEAVEAAAGAATATTAAFTLVCTGLDTCPA